MPGLRCRVNGVRVNVNNAHVSCRRPTSGFGTWGSSGLRRGRCGTGRNLERFFHFPVSQFALRRSPRVLIKLAGISYPFLLDTGAELSVIPSYILSRIPPGYFGNTPRTHSVHGFAGRDVIIIGSYPLPVEVCGVKFIHPFYTLDSQTPCVAGYDLICAVKLVIDPIRYIV